MKRVLVWGSIVVVVLVGLATAGYFAFLRPSAARVLTGSSAKVTREDLDVLVKCQGLIVAATTIEVKSRASGYVQKIHGPQATG
jgi:multidrug efflux pump subunit AcrA (membrane-fusion protein)